MLMKLSQKPQLPEHTNHSMLITLVEAAFCGIYTARVARVIAIVVAWRLYVVFRKHTILHFAAAN